MNLRSLDTLEFDKIREMLAGYASCEMGREKCFALIPMTDIVLIKRRLCETSEARTIIQKHGSLPLGGITDVRSAIDGASKGSILSARQLIDIAYTLRAASKLASFLLKQKEEYPLLAEIAGRIVSFSKFESKVESAISSDGEVVDSASPKLQKLRTEMRASHSKILERLNAIIQSRNIRNALQDPIITQREGRYCVPVKTEHKSLVKGIVHDASASGATLFIEPSQIVELGNTLKQLEAMEQEEIERILAELSAEIGASSDDVLTTLEAVAEIDFANAKAKFSIAQNAVEPYINREGFIRFRAARHPLLKGNVVPIDIELGRSETALLITGPNTGGKTVTLKTIGLLTLMAQSGLHIPAGFDSEAAIFDEIFADIGDEQSIEQSLSTFSSHMRNIVDVIKQADRNSLVLLDEIGAGTDPAEGAALAKSILDELVERGCRVVATTHYGELKEYAYLRDGVRNASVEFDIETLQPTYRLLIGIPGSSNALAIAKRLGLPDSIVARAESEIKNRQGDAGDAILRIEKTEREAAEDREYARLEAKKAEELRRKYEDLLQKLEDSRGRVLNEISEEAKKMLDHYEHLLADAIAQINRVGKPGKELEEARQNARRLTENIRTEISHINKGEEDDSIPERLPSKKGEAVRVVGMDIKGVLAEDVDGDRAVVLAGVMKLNVPASSLRPAEGSAIERPSTPEKIGISIEMKKTTEISPEIMLRGRRVEAALYDLDKYLYDAQSAGLTQVRVIHGKGTGVLRKAVWEFLSEHPAVASYKIAEQSQGGIGATIVDLKF